MSDLPKINEVYIIKDDKGTWQLCTVVRIADKTGLVKCVVKFISSPKSVTVTADRLCKTIDGKFEPWMYKKKKNKIKGRVK